MSRAVCRENFDNKLDDEPNPSHVHNPSKQEALVLGSPGAPVVLKATKANVPVSQITAPSAGCSCLSSQGNDYCCQCLQLVKECEDLTD